MTTVAVRLATSEDTVVSNPQQYILNVGHVASAAAGKKPN